MSGEDHGGDRPPDETWRSYRMSTDERPTEAAVMAVVAVTGTKAEELDPIFEAVDPDGLDLVFSPATDTGTDLRLTFTYCGCEVEVTNQHVRVRESD